MILVDTSIWIDHLRAGSDLLAKLLNTGRVLAHPFVIGELALGEMRQRETILEALSNPICFESDLSWGPSPERMTNRKRLKNRNGDSIFQR